MMIKSTAQMQAGLEQIKAMVEIDKHEAHIWIMIRAEMVLIHNDIAYKNKLKANGSLDITAQARLTLLKNRLALLSKLLEDEKGLETYIYKYVNLSDYSLYLRFCESHGISALPRNAYTHEYTKK